MMSFDAFSSVNLPAPLLEAVGALGFTSMTPVQAAALPPILAGKDVLVRADTGSGKTATFGLGMLARLDLLPIRVQGLVLCPTRELAAQVSHEVRRLAQRSPNVKVLALCGGEPFGMQRKSLAHGAHIVVGTPGRLDEHLRKASLDLAHLRVLVLDEADRMLDMGFEPQIARVVALAPAVRQTLLFSATYPSTIAELSRSYQNAALSLDVPRSRSPAAGAETLPDGASANGGVQHHFYELPARDHTEALSRWLERERPESTLVFCSTRQECLDVAAELARKGWEAAAINGDMPQQERRHVMRLFANKSCSVLAATDLAARGWDITGLSVVVNLGLSRDPTVHLHRMGRTGRSGQPGQVVSFVGEGDQGRLRAIERVMGAPALFSEPPPSSPSPRAAYSPPMLTLLLAAGKDKKLRPGDILGALTAEGGVQAGDVGDIEIDERHAYVAVRREQAERALAHLLATTVKGFRVKARVAGLSFREPR